jgi:hypothetical protein
MPQRPNADLVWTADELERDATGIIACMETVRGCAEAMRREGVQSVRVIRGPSFARTLESAKTWSRSVLDGFDEALDESRPGDEDENGQPKAGKKKTKVGVRKAPKTDETGG